MKSDRHLNEKKLAQLQRLAIAPGQIHNGEILLDREQQHYLSRVLRLRSPDRFIAMDGKGQWWLTQLSENPESATILEAIAVTKELPISVTLIVGLPKTGFDDLVRQLVEVGVTTIIPAISDRTLLKPSPQKCDRWRRIAIEAAEQSERQIVPAILDPIPFTDYFATERSSDISNSCRYICVARGEAPHLNECLQDRDLTGVEQAEGNIAIATGPEGGWTPQEIDRAIAAGFQSVSLGRRILRAVTAPIVALSLVAAAVESRYKN